MTRAELEEYILTALSQMPLDKAAKLVTKVATSELNNVDNQSGNSTFFTGDIFCHAITADRLATASSVDVSHLQFGENVPEDFKHF